MCNAVRDIVEEGKGKMRVKLSVYYRLQRTGMKRKAGTDWQVEDTILSIAKFLLWGFEGAVGGMSKSRLQGW